MRDSEAVSKSHVSADISSPFIIQFLSAVPFLRLNQVYINLPDFVNFITDDDRSLGLNA